jgi:pimeloyl-ACP methyl ester carboxylesterase
LRAYGHTMTANTRGAELEVADNGRSVSGEETRSRMLAGAAVTERRLQVAGVSTSVLEGGAGPPLVLLHGGIECGGAVWAPVAGALADGHRLVVPDLPGLGESEPLTDLNVDTFAQWLVELLRQTCPKKPTLIAHSLGGSLATRFFTEHGDLVRRLVIYAAPAIGPYRMPLGLRVVAIRFGLRPSQRTAERFARYALLDLDRTRRRDPRWFEAFSSYTLSRAVIPHVKRTMRQLINTGTRRVPDAQLRRIAIPTALLWGKHDRMVPAGLAEAASNRLGWSLHLIDEAAHVPHIEQPEGFLRALSAILGPDVHRYQNEAGDAYYVPPGHTPVHHAGAEIVEFSPTEILGETIPVVMRNLQAAGAEVGSTS